MSGRLRNWVLKSIIILESGLIGYCIIAIILGGRADLLKVYRPEHLRWFLPILIGCAYGVYRQYLTNSNHRNSDELDGVDKKARDLVKHTQVAVTNVGKAEIESSEPNTVVAPIEVVKATEHCITIAEDAWKKAREMRHQVIPDPVGDAEYLELVTFAAHNGHGEAMLKMAEYANRRKCCVEEYFWLSLAKMAKVPNVVEALSRCRRNWVTMGCNPEYDNEYSCFSVMDGSFSRALLNLDSRINAPMARVRLRELADLGYDNAKCCLRL